MFPGSAFFWAFLAALFVCAAWVLYDVAASSWRQPSTCAGGSDSDDKVTAMMLAGLSVVAGWVGIMLADQCFMRMTFNRGTTGMFPLSAFVWALIGSVLFAAARVLYDKGTDDWRGRYVYQWVMAFYAGAVVAVMLGLMVAYKSYLLVAYSHS